MPSHACNVCGRISPTGRCPEHPAPRSPSSRATGTRAHRRRRKRMLDRTDRTCHICLRPILPGEPLDADHVYPVATHGPDGPLLPAHSRCNRSKGANI